MRSFLVRFFRAFLRVFYRRIDIVGLENVPRDRGVLYAVNHPNGLVDPLFVLCFAPGPVSFLAKAPLFGYPLIGWFARTLESIPVYRREDGVSGSNAETFARARELLARGGSIAIFPEGTTHSDPQLHDLKTGAARLAHGASLPSVVIIPTGIDYTAKQTFRSNAVVVFGSGIAVLPRAGPDGEPFPPAVEALTAEIQRGLAAVTLQADSRAALEIIERAERIFSGGSIAHPAEELELRRRFVDGYHFLSARDPARLAELSARIARFESELRAARLDPETLESSHGGGMGKSLAIVLLSFPIALAGALVHYPTYRLVGALSNRFAKGESEMTATMKFVAALLLFPITWIVLSVIVGRWLGIRGAAATLFVLPILGYVALTVFETLDDVIGRVRSLTRRLFRRSAYARLVQQRRVIREQIMKVADEMRGA
jgi:glycerol-3-phosphate O-acyltransferase/dihydroxyacetone phosphate acyltransferase